MTTQIITGTDKADTLATQGYTDKEQFLVRGKLTNSLFAGAGDDTLLAGGGNLNADGINNDVLFGEAGNDVYRFETRWGSDRVVDAQGSNRIEFGATVKRSSLTFWRNGADLTVREAGADSLLTVTDFFARSPSGGPSSFTGLSFGDGSTMSIADVRSLVEKSSRVPVPLYVKGSLNNGSYAAALAGSTALSGSTGDDRLVSTSANEVFEDYFSYKFGQAAGNMSESSAYKTGYGGSGNDTYVFSGSFGQDRILDVEGVYNGIGGSASAPEQDVIVFNDLLASDLSFYLRANFSNPLPSLDGGTRPTRDLIIQSRTTADAVTVVDQLNTALGQGNGTVARFGVAYIQFADGTRWDRAMIEQQATNWQSPPAVPGPTGTSGNDTLVADGPWSPLVGGQGSDTYVISQQPCAFLIDSTGNTATDQDVIRFNLNANQVSWQQSSTNLVLTSGLMSVIVADYGVAGANTVSKLVFADGQTQDVRTFAAGFDFQTSVPPTPGRVEVSYGTLVGTDGKDVFVWGAAYANTSLSNPLAIQQLRPEQGDHVLLDNINYSLQLDSPAVAGEFRLRVTNGAGAVLVVSVPTDTRPLSSSDVLFRFTDGSAWTVADVNARLAASPTAPAPDAVALGTVFDDYMDGRSVYRGGRGNDTLLGYGATYLYDLGDGDDVVGSYSGSSGRVAGGASSVALKLGAGITLADLKLKPTDVVTSWFSSDSYSSLNWFTGKVSAELLTFASSPGSISAIGSFTSIQLADGTVLDDVAMAGLRGVVLGRDGNDTLTASSAGQLVNGRGGNDSLIGGAGNDTLLGDLGNDTLSGGTGNDTLVGGLGSDTLSGGAGSDTYQYSVGDGADLVHADSLDTLSLGFDSFALKIGKLGATVANAVVLTNGTAGDSITLDNAGSWAGLQLKFADGSSLTGADILAQATSLTLTGTTKADVLTGKDGNDTLSGLAGNDTLAGGKGNDSLIGGKGNDTYLFNRGDGQDTIVDTDSTFFNSDLLKLGGATSKQLWLTKTGKDLGIQILGTQDKVTVQNWFSGSSNQVEKITASDGKSLSASKVNALVNAMASFTPPADAASLPANTPAAVTKLVASSWA
jgi:Ca2+-binding RTX toxin-like protein